jgi:hypothetical protein
MFTIFDSFCGCVLVDVGAQVLTSTCLSSASTQTHCQVSREPASASSFMRLLKSRGFFGMWRGASAMFVACIPSHAAYFSVYEVAKECLGANRPGHHPVAAASAGVLATVLHDGVLTPMDCVKQRLQLGVCLCLRPPSASSPMMSTLYRVFMSCLPTLLQVCTVAWSTASARWCERRGWQRSTAVIQPRC